MQKPDRGEISMRKSLKVVVSKDGWDDGDDVEDSFGQRGESQEHASRNGDDEGEDPLRS